MCCINISLISTGTVSHARLLPWDKEGSMVSPDDVPRMRNPKVHMPKGWASGPSKARWQMAAALWPSVGTELATIIYMWMAIQSLQSIFTAAHSLEPLGTQQGRQPACEVTRVPRYQKVPQLAQGLPGINAESPCYISYISGLYPGLTCFPLPSYSPPATEETMLV